MKNYFLIFFLVAISILLIGCNGNKVEPAKISGDAVSNVVQTEDENYTITKLKEDLRLYIGEDKQGDSDVKEFIRFAIANNQKHPNLQIYVSLDAFKGKRNSTNDIDKLNVILSSIGQDMSIYTISYEEEIEDVGSNDIKIKIKQMEGTPSDPEVPEEIVDPLMHGIIPYESLNVDL